MIFSWYIAKLYFKYSILIITALVIFFVGLDLISQAAKLPDSANLVLLYVLFQAAYSLEIILPIALIFGAIAAKIHLIRASELVAGYSLGASRLQALKPFMVVAFSFAFAHIVASSTDFAYSYEKATAIKKDKFHSSVTTDLFLKYNDSFVYIKQLLPLQKEAVDLEIVTVVGSDLLSHLKAKRAYFVDRAWQLEDVVLIEKPIARGLQSEGIITRSFDSQTALEGFRPEIIDRVYESKTAYSIIDAIDAIMLFSKQGINTDKLRGVLYSSLIIPFTTPIVVALIFLYLPISSRFFNIALFASVAVFASLVAWGVLFALSQMARNGALQPELALLLPFSLLTIFVGYLIKKEL